jgi:hypothetical protein
MSFPDRRRKLSTRDYVTLKLASETHSIGELSKIFKIHENWVRRILRSPNLRCPICRKWKLRGTIFKSETNPEHFLWICRDCIKTECA